MKLNILKLDAPSMSLSILDSEYGSLEPTLLRMVKSMHIRHFPDFFFTITMLAKHMGYLISWMNLASSKKFTFFPTTNLLSSPFFCFLWVICFTLGTTNSLSHTTSRPIYGIYVGAQEKRSSFTQPHGVFNIMYEPCF